MNNSTLTPLRSFGFFELLTAEIVMNATSNAIQHTRNFTQLLSDKIALSFINHDTKIQIITSSLLLLGFVCFLTISGSYASVEKPVNALDPNPYHPLFDQSDVDKTFYPDTSVDTPTAFAMPVLSGGMLTGLYILVSRLDPETISTLLSYSFLGLGITAVNVTISFFCKVISRKVAFWLGISSTVFNPRYRVTIAKDSAFHPAGVEAARFLPEDTVEQRVIKEEALKSVRDPIKSQDQIQNVYYTKGDIIATTASFITVGILGLLDYRHNWILNNIFAMLLVVTPIGRIQVASFKVALALLGCFFIYDISFVFGTNIMITVATKIEVPLAIRFPRSLSKNGMINYNLLGLGDIVLPGIIIALCLRFDLYNFHRTNPRTEFHHLQWYPKAYFRNTLFAHLLGLILSMIAVNVYHRGQPALLYIAPLMAISIVSTAYFRDELSIMWNYVEGNNSNIEQKDIEVDILCSKDTLFLAGKITDSDEESEEEDADYTPDFDVARESDFEGEEEED